MESTNIFYDYFEILGIEYYPSREVIDLAFKEQAVKWHPDFNTETNTTEKFRLIYEAYLVLITAGEYRSYYPSEYRLFDNLRFKDKVDFKSNELGIKEYKALKVFKNSVVVIEEARAKSYLNYQLYFDSVKEKTQFKRFLDCHF